MYEQPPMPKLNYDDFYKFVISLGIPTILTYSFFATYSLLQQSYLLFAVHLSLAAIAAAFVFWAMNKWYARQKIIDETLRTELELQKLEVKEK